MDNWLKKKEKEEKEKEEEKYRMKMYKQIPEPGAFLWLLEYPTYEPTTILRPSFIRWLLEDSTSTPTILTPWRQNKARRMH